jgi:hypothetical protein
MISGEDVARVRLESRLPDADSLAKPSLERLHTQLGTDRARVGPHWDMTSRPGQRLRRHLSSRTT